MVKRLSIVLLALLAATLFVSCDNGGSDNAIQTSGSKVVGVTMKIQLQSSKEQVLSITSGTADINNIAYYEYRATPKWTSVDWGSVQGATSVWTVLAQDETLWFTQGLWLIEARAYSAGGKLTLDYRTFGGETVVFSAFTATRNDHIITFTATIPVDAGSYVLNFLFGDSNVDFIYGETYVAEVFANMTTAVTGDLALGTLVRAGKSAETNADKDETVSFVCLSTADEYHWYVNDTKMQSGDRHFFVFTPTDYGTYTVECRLDDSSSASEIGTIVLYVRKAITITLHFENNAVLTCNTYSGVMTKSDLSHYLTSIYDGKWYTKAENGTGGTANGGREYTSTAAFTDDIDLYAHRNYCTVTFNKNYSGTGANNITLSATTIKGYQGTALGELPEITIKKGSGWNSSAPSVIFRGWYTESGDDDGDKVTEDTLISGNVTYHAHWTTLKISSPDNGEVAVVFGSMFNDNGTWKYQYKTSSSGWMSSGPYSVTIGSKITNYSNYISYPDGYSYVEGWYKSYKWQDDKPVLYDKWDFDKDTVNSNMILYANAVNTSDYLGCTDKAY